MLFRSVYIGLSLSSIQAPLSLLSSIQAQHAFSSVLLLIKTCLSSLCYCSSIPSVPLLSSLYSLSSLFSSSFPLSPSFFYLELLSPWTIPSNLIGQTKGINCFSMSPSLWCCLRHLMLFSSIKGKGPDIDVFCMCLMVCDGAQGKCAGLAVGSDARVKGVCCLHGEPG